MAKKQQQKKKSLWKSIALSLLFALLLYHPCTQGPIISTAVSSTLYNFRQVFFL